MKEFQTPSERDSRFQRHKEPLNQWQEELLPGQRILNEGGQLPVYHPPQKGRVVDISMESSIVLRDRISDKVVAWIGTSGGSMYTNFGDVDGPYDTDQLEEDIRKELDRRGLIGFSIEPWDLDKNEKKTLTSVEVISLEYLTGGKSSGEYLDLEDE